MGAIPTSRGTTLDGASVTLPVAGPARPTILVVGFSRNSRAAVAGWERRLDADTILKQSPTVAWYQVAMLGAVPRILRGLVVSQIRSSVPEKDRAHFLSLTENEAAWRAAVHFAQPDDAYVLLVDPAGAVRWRIAGDATDDAYRQLRRQLADIANTR